MSKSFNMAMLITTSIFFISCSLGVYKCSLLLTYDTHLENVIIAMKGSMLLVCFIILTLLSMCLAVFSICIIKDNDLHRIKKRLLKAMPLLSASLLILLLMVLIALSAENIVVDVIR